ncbi:hypothetical protein OQA88_13304 [Cercophora sp. LCS_1]
MSPTTTGGFKYFRLAAHSNNEAALRYFSSHLGRSVLDKQTDSGLSALDIAIKEGWAGAVRTLLELGTKQKMDKAGITPIIRALMHNHHEIVEILEASLDRHTATLQTAAARRELRTSGMRHALEEAIMNDNVETCDRLFETGCPLNQPLLRCLQCPPLLLALRNDMAEVANWLLVTGDDLNILGPICDRRSEFEDGSTPKTTIDIAASSPTLVRLLRKLLTEATQSSILDGCTTLNDVLPVLVNVKSDHSNPDSSATALSLLMSEDDLSAIILMLLEAGANAEIRNAELRTPLLEAMRFSEMDAARGLVARGADVHVLDRYGYSALAFLTDVSSFSYFLALGLDPLLSDIIGLCSLHYAVNPSQPKLPSFVLGSPGMLIAMPCIPAYTASEDPENFFSFVSDLPPIQRRLARVGRRESLVDLQPEGSGIIRPLCVTAQYGHITMQSLLSVGAEIGFDGCPDRTALMTACRMGRSDAVKLLVQAGAAILFTNRNTSTQHNALDAARRSPKIARWLLVERWPKPSWKRLIIGGSGGIGGSLVVLLERKLGHFAGASMGFSGLGS